MSNMRKDRDRGVIEITVGDEYIDRETFDRMMKAFTDLIEACGKIRVIEIVEEFPQFDPGVIREDLKFSYKNIDNIERCAVVSDRGWVGPYARMIGVLTPCEIRVFRTGELDQARSWIYGDENKTDDQTANRS